MIVAETARISQRSDMIIQEMALLTGKPKIEIIEQALETYRRQERFRLFNDSYTELRASSMAWQEELQEREELEGTMSDGLKEE